MTLIVFTPPANTIPSPHQFFCYRALYSCWLRSMYSFFLGPQMWQLVRSGGCLSQTVLRWRLFLTRWQQLQVKPECAWLSKADRQLRRKTNPIPDYHSTSESKDGLRVAFLQIFHLRIFEHHYVKHPQILKCKIHEYGKSVKYKPFNSIQYLAHHRNV